MKTSTLVTLLLFIGVPTFSQTILDKEQQLVGFLKSHKFIESKYIAYGDSIESGIWRIADSLFSEMPIQNVTSYFNDSSYLLKYYSFLKMLDLQGDEFSFPYFKNSLTDTTKVPYFFNKQVGSEKFNQLIATEYFYYLQMKYNGGGTVTLGDNHYLGKNKYRFARSLVGEWPKKLKDFNTLITPYGLKLR